MEVSKQGGEKASSVPSDVMACYGETTTIANCDLQFHPTNQDKSGCEVCSRGYNQKSN
jgi:hypothetical protein